MGFWLKDAKPLLSGLHFDFERVRVRGDQTTDCLIWSLATTPDLGMTIQTSMKIITALDDNNLHKVRSN